MISTTDYEKVEFHLAGRTLKDLDFIGKSDPQVKLYLNRNGSWSLVGETEVVKENLNPDFKTTIPMDFIFETQQNLKFEVWDADKTTSDDLIGSVETTVGAIMGARKQTLTLDLKTKNDKNAGKLVVKGERSGEAKNNIFWQWSGVNLMNVNFMFGKSNPVLKFFKVRSQDDTLLAHETEVCTKNLDPVWKMFKITDDKLCSGKLSQSIRVECWDRRTGKADRFIGSIEITLDQLKSGDRDFTLNNPKKKKAGVLRLLQFTIERKYSLVDYLRSGTQLSLIGAVDFTASNGPVDRSDSLHFINQARGLNEYQRALQAVGSILLNYDYDQQVPMYGFGGKPKFPGLTSAQVSHCFPCSGDHQKAQVVGLPGLMEVYQYALKHVELSGPTKFQPLIQEAAKTANFHKTTGTGVYSILLILTDGEIHDMDETIDAIVAAAYLPLSIVIVGVGAENFKMMKVLDGDEGLVDSKRNKSARDFVQFVAFRDYSDITRLSSEVLAEIPEQVVGYMKLIDQKPAYIAQ